jgi:hypothetical protein
MTIKYQERRQTKMEREIKKQEAIRRLEKLYKKGMTFGHIIENFKEGKDIGIFEYQNPVFNSAYYVLYGNQNQDFYKKIIAKKDELEKEYGMVVYLILISHTEFGDLCDFIFVGDYKEDWEYEDLINDNMLYSYCWNMSDDICSDFGSIGFEVSKSMGGIYRTA